MVYKQNAKRTADETFGALVDSQILILQNYKGSKQ
jgi:hypothetical protein